jgi:hypothetical protein
MVISQECSHRSVGTQPRELFHRSIVLESGTRAGASTAENRARHRCRSVNRRCAELRMDRQRFNGPRQSLQSHVKRHPESTLWRYEELTEGCGRQRQSGYAGSIAQCALPSISTVQSEPTRRISSRVARNGGMPLIGFLGLRARETRNQHLPGCAVNADVGHFPRPDIQVRLEGFPGCKAAATAFFFTFRRRSRSCLWCERDTAHTPVVGIPVLGKANSLSLNTTLRVTAS